MFWNLRASGTFKKRVLEYRKLQGDSVHFKDYLPIGQNLLKFFVSVFATPASESLVRNVSEFCLGEGNTHSLQNVGRKRNFRFVKNI